MIDLSGRDTRSIMTVVALCLTPGLLLQGLLLDPFGVSLNVLASVTAGVLTERGCEGLRGRTLPRGYSALDATTLVTCLIIAAALPPGAWAFAALAAALGVGLGRQAYGGLGNNLFNPAMVGYCLVLVSFPAAFNWPAQAPDALSGATVLTTFKYRGAATVDDVWTANAGFGTVGGLGYEWIAITYAAGGAVLFYRRLAAWRPAAGFLLALTVAALLGYDNGSSKSLGSPSYHVFSGSSLMAAAFVLTDPVTHPRGHRAQWLFGAVVGLMTFAIRAWGNYPDGIAFAVLFGNAVGPYLDRRLSHQAPAHD